MKVAMENQFKIVKTLLILVLIWSFVSVISYNINSYLKYRIFLELQKNGIKNNMNCILKCITNYVNPNFPIINWS